MKKVTLHVDDKFGEEIIMGFVGGNGKNIVAHTAVLEQENEFKVRADGKLTDLRKLEGNDEWDN